MKDREQTGAEALYLIRVRGILDEGWSDWFGGVEMAPEQAVDGSPITMLTGIFDHAALHGVLAKLRDLNLTLISVTRLESERAGSAPELRTETGQPRSGSFTGLPECHPR